MRMRFRMVFMAVLVAAIHVALPPSKASADPVAEFYAGK